MSETRTVRTTCKIGAGEPYCGIEVDVTDGRMTAVRGDKEHPVSKGYLCIKGRSLREYQNDPDRRLTPMRRTSGGRDRFTGMPIFNGRPGSIARAKAQASISKPA